MYEKLTPQDFANGKVEHMLSDNTSFVVFTPIESPDKVRQYYIENNLEYPDNEYFNNMFVKPYSEELSEQEVADKKGEKTSPERKSLNEYIASTSKMSPLTRAINIINPSIIYNKGKVDPVTEAINNLDNVSPEDKELLISHPIAEEIRSLNLEDDKKKYITSLAFYESSFTPKATSTEKHKGMFQFSDAALNDIGMTSQELLADSTNQYRAAILYADFNARLLKPIIDRYVGSVKGGVKITEQGIRAAAHLLGAGAVKDWFNNTLNTKIARNGFVDGNNTHITKYLERFSK